MHLFTIPAYAFLFWNAENPGRWVCLAKQDVLATLLIVLGQPIVLASFAYWGTRRVAKRMEISSGDLDRDQLFYHRLTMALRALAVVGFGCSVFLTPWAGWFAWGSVSPVLQIAGDLVVLLPFYLSLVGLWVAAYPLERQLRDDAWIGDGQDAPKDDGAPTQARPFTLARYLDFHVRHSVLVVAVPMFLILLASNLANGYETQLRTVIGWVWAPEAMVASATLAVFLVAPTLLRRVWRTRPLPPGTLRTDLETLCRRIGFRCRDILVWESDGTMINAAVMGIIPRFRYVLLSDALLEHMSQNQVKAVFGHEAGHVRHRHIQHFLLFAFVGWLVVAGTMELVAYWATSSSSGKPAVSLMTIEGLGLGATIAIWGLGFGWLSRRFERQADSYGACCVSPDAANCDLSCSVHSPTTSSANVADRICMTGARVFTSSLERVASLNGIPMEEYSWRHSSIGIRIRCLASIAGDPARATRFARSIRRIKRFLLVSALVGLLCSVYYWAAVPRSAILRLQSSVVQTVSSP